MKKNKTIKTGLAIVVMVVSLIFTVNAQAPKGQRQGPPKPPTAEQIVQMVDKMAEELNLTEDQKAMVLKLHQEHFAEMETIMKKQKEQHEANREEMKTLRKKFESSIKQNLTEEQAKEFNEYLKNNRPQEKGPKQKR